MNIDENTKQLLEQLADKLGTTSEYLWSVLVKQAPISSAFKLATMVILAVTLACTFKWVKRTVAADEDFFPLWIVWFIGLAIVLAMIGLGGPLILAGFFNPEYWALRQILDTLKN